MLTATDSKKKKQEMKRAQKHGLWEELNELQTFCCKTNWKTIKVYPLSKASQTNENGLAH